MRGPGCTSSGAPRSSRRASSGAVDVVRISAIQGNRRPRTEGLGKRQRAVVIGVDQHARLLAREPLDAQWARQAHERAVEPVAVDQRGALARVLTAEVDHVGTLVGEVQDHQAVLAAHERKLAARGERLHERLGPEMLVYVDLHQIVDQFYVEYHMSRPYSSGLNSCSGTCTRGSGADGSAGAGRPAAVHGGRALARRAPGKERTGRRLIRTRPLFFATLDVGLSRTAGARLIAPDRRRTQCLGWSAKARHYERKRL
jgi:hypothetical protein